MNNILIGTRTAMLAAALLGITGAARAELVTNGSFTDANDAFAGWTVSGNTAGNYFGPGISWDGEPLGAALGTGGSPIFLSQDIATVIGASYVFSFNVKGYDPNNTQPNGIAYFRADIGATTVLNATLDTLLWQTVSQTFTATDTTTHLVFESQNDWDFYHLDQVSVMDAASVPEPATAALAFGALLLAGALRRQH